MSSLSDDEWARKLTPEQFHILREKGTEMPFTGKLLYNDKAGSYTCAACGNVLFDSDTKFDTNCGWPSFYDAKPGSVKLTRDTSFGMIRDEVTCANCGGHLGHVFDDAPDQPTGMRFCVNSAALQFLPKSKK
ncbi:MAG TPA: peptide-methionine (R)-S-oxide reductase MsrB [Candidatus Saccharimonadales bacterium]|jgi:peptide-methionine (R)-S-oxide reductase|nr:peptide-methionine (R)-S-oxide reductase MsrB [Candidatus Saccharimonadales bacterium]